MALLLKILNIILVLVNAYKNKKTVDRIDDIRNNPADAWLSKFGGKDERASTKNTERKNN